MLSLLRLIVKFFRLMWRIHRWIIDHHSATLDIIIAILVVSICGILAPNEACEARIEDVRQQLDSAQYDLNAIKEQVKLINDYNDEIAKAQTEVVRFFSAFDTYCKLQDKDESILPWNTLSNDEREFMMRLKTLIGLNEIPCHGANSVKNLIMQLSNQAIANMSAQVEEFQSALYTMDITKMKQLQQKIDDETLSKRLNFNEFKSQISSKTYEIETVSLLKRICWLLIEIVNQSIPKFAMVIVDELFK